MSTDVAATSFAQFLRRHRLTAGLNREELAVRTGLSARTITDLERGARLIPHKETVRLPAAFGPAGQEHADFVTAARRRPPPDVLTDPLPAASAPGRLPFPPTPLLGREQDLARAAALLLQVAIQLLMPAGSGGIGKRRPAVTVARPLEERFAEGALLRDPAPVRATRIINLSPFAPLVSRHHASLLGRQLLRHRPATFHLPDLPCGSSSGTSPVCA